MIRVPQVGDRVIVDREFTGCDADTDEEFLIPAGTEMLIEHRFLYEGAQGLQFQLAGPRGSVVCLDEGDPECAGSIYPFTLAGVPPGWDAIEV